MDIEEILPERQDVAAVLREDVANLPSPPVVAVKLLKLVRRENASTDELTRVIETDPAISAKVLRIVNSAHYGLRNKISSIGHAVVLLGFAEIRNLALEVSLFEQLTGKHGRHAFDRTFFWRHCLSTAKLAQAIAAHAGHPDPSEVYVAGLLHDVGKIVTDVYGRITYGAFLIHMANSDEVMEEEERKLIGLGHDDVGAYVCAEWGLPDPIVLAIKFHHQRFGRLPLDSDARLLIAAVALANFITWTQGLGSAKMLRHPILQPEVEEIIDLSAFRFGDLIRRMDEEVKGIAEFYEFSFPTTDQFRENLLYNNLRLCRMNTKFYYMHDNLKHKLHSLHRIKRSIVQPHQSLDPEEIIRSTLTAIQQDFHFDRLFAFGIDRPLGLLTQTGGLDPHGGRPLPHINIPLHKKAGAFLACLRNQEPRIMEGDSRAEQNILQLLQVNAVGLVPITSNSRSTGLIMVDNYRSRLELRIEELEAVAIIANELGLALENARCYEEVKSLAFIDGLTGINNRVALDRYLDKAVARSRAGGGPVTLGMVDVDYFKRFNDDFGHLAGDSVLKLLATIMKKVSRPTDVVGRFGGEEFMFILRDTAMGDGLRYAERLRREVAKLGRLLTERFPGRPLTISIGVAALESTMARGTDLVKAADAALYRAKKNGRNQVRAHRTTEAPRARSA